MALLPVASSPPTPGLRREEWQRGAMNGKGALLRSWGHPKAGQSAVSVWQSTWPRKVCGYFSQVLPEPTLYSLRSFH